MMSVDYLVCVGSASCGLDMSVPSRKELNRREEAEG